MNDEINWICDSIKENLTSNHSKTEKKMATLIQTFIKIRESEYTNIPSDLRWNIEYYHRGLVKILLQFLKSNNPRADIDQISNVYDKIKSWRNFLSNPTWDFFTEELWMFNKDYCYYQLLKLFQFNRLNIQENELIEKTRNYYEQISNDYHANEEPIRFVETVENIKKLFVNTFKLWLLTEICRTRKEALSLNDFEESMDGFRLSQKFPELMSLSESEFFNVVLEQIFSNNKMRDLFQKQNVFSNERIITSQILQKFYPIVYLDAFLIDRVLSEQEVELFRFDGPHIVDFKFGQWVYRPKICNKIYNRLINKESVHIKGPSGYGKTIIARNIGFQFYKKKTLVFYFDILNINEKKLQHILEYLERMKTQARLTKKSLIIFDNVQNLEKNQRESLKTIQDKYLTCLIEKTPSSHKTKNDKDSESDLSNEKIEFNVSSECCFEIDNQIFTEIQAGIVKKNIDAKNIQEQINSIPIDNLWIISIILRMYKNQDEKNKKTISQLCSDAEIVSNELDQYFISIIKKEGITFEYKSSALGNFMNHLRLVLYFVSIFSQEDCWISRKFILDIFCLKKPSIIEIKDRISFSKKRLSETIEVLVKNKILLYKEEKLPDGVYDDSFRIAHSRLAAIYHNIIGWKNIILSKIKNVILIEFISQAKIPDRVGKFFTSRFELIYSSQITDPLYNTVIEHLLSNKYTEKKSEKLFLKMDFRQSLKILDINKYILKKPHDKLMIWVFDRIDENLELWQKLIADIHHYDLIRFLNQIINNPSMVFDFHSNFSTQIKSKIGQASYEELTRYAFVYFDSGLPKDNPRLEEIQNAIKEGFMNISLDERKKLLLENMWYIRISHIIADRKDLEHFFNDLIENFYFEMFEMVNLVFEMKLFHLSHVWHTPFFDLWIHQHHNNQNNVKFWKAMKKKMEKSTVGSLISLMHYGRNHKSLNSTNGNFKEIIVEYLIRFDSLIIQMIQDDQLRRREDRFEFVIDIFEWIKMLGIETELADTLFYTDKKWILSILKTASLMNLEKDLWVYLPELLKDELFSKEIEKLSQLKFKNILNNCHLPKDFEMMLDKLTSFYRSYPHNRYRDETIKKLIEKVVSTRNFEYVFIKHLYSEDIEKILLNQDVEDIILDLGFQEIQELINFHGHKTFNLLNVNADYFSHELGISIEFLKDLPYDIAIRSTFSDFLKIYRDEDYINLIQSIPKISYTYITDMLESSRKSGFSKVNKKKLIETFNWILEHKELKFITLMNNFINIFPKFYEYIDSDKYNTLFKILMEKNHIDLLKIILIANPVSHQGKVIRFSISFIPNLYQPLVNHILDHPSSIKHSFLHKLFDNFNLLDFSCLSIERQEKLLKYIQTPEFYEKLINNSTIGQISLTLNTQWIFMYSYNPQKIQICQLIKAQNDTENQCSFQDARRIKNQNANELLRWDLTSFPEEILVMANEKTKVSKETILSLVFEKIDLAIDKLKISSLFELNLFVDFALSAKEVRIETKKKLVKEIFNLDLISKIEQYDDIYDLIPMLLRIQNSLDYLNFQDAEIYMKPLKSYYLSEKFLKKLKNLPLDTIYQFYKEEILQVNKYSNINLIELIKKRMNNLTAQEFIKFFFPEKPKYALMRFSSPVVIKKQLFIPKDVRNRIYSAYKEEIDESIANFLKPNISSLYNGYIKKQMDKKAINRFEFEERIFDLIENKMSETYWYETID